MSTENMILEPDGILLVDKPEGKTSHDVVWKVRKLFGTKKVGHTGTLDPMATGVLVVLLGRAAKACEYVSHDEKVYEATLRLGLTTDTEDVTGTTLTTGDTLPTPAEVEEILSALENEELYGMVLRAKGIVASKEGRWIHFDYVPGETDVREGAADIIGRLCVIGSKIKEDNLSELFGI